MRASLLNIPAITLVALTPVIAADLTGSWKLKASMGEMSFDLVCTFKDEGGKLTGTCKAEQIGELATTGNVEGKHVTFQYNVDYQGQSFTLVYKGTLDSDSLIKGSILVSDQPSGEFTATRVGAPAPSAAPAAPKSIFWDANKISRAEHQIVVENNVKVPMRDGVTLATDIYRPAGEGKYPTILVRTPYNKSSADDIKSSKWFAERGYVVIMQDVRGRFASDGEFYAYRHEADDGFDTDSWIVKQSWSNGKIGTMGGSYLGYTQLSQSVRKHTALTAMAVDVTSYDIYHGWTYVDGAFHLGFTLPWGAGIIHEKKGQSGRADYAFLPVAGADQPLGKPTPHYRDWLKHNRRNDPYWNNISHENDAKHINVPLLVVAGWYDIFLRGTLADHISIRTENKNPVARENKRLIIGPWVHTKAVFPSSAGGVDFGPDAGLDTNYLYLAWHDHWLKGIDNGVGRDAPVKLFVMGENKWRDEQEWPLARTRYTKYYIASGGKANTAKGDGVLSTELPKGAESDAYTYDPLNPVPSVGGNVCCSSVPHGMKDHQTIETRPDVLVFSTPELKEAVEVTGPIKMTLYASTSAKDTDWVVRLIDVHPDGKAMNIQDGILRARYKDGKHKPAKLLVPGKVYAFEVDLWASSNLFLPGHKIRLEVTSSNFPRFDRNLNTGEDPATGTKVEKAHQTIYHSAKYPSHVVLPIIPR